MLRFLRATLIGLAVLVVLVAGGGWFLLKDPNRFKPQLEAVIRDQGGVPVTIDGDLSWRLWPPISLSAADLKADYQGQLWQVGRLTVDLDAWNVLRDPQQWQVQSFRIADVTMEDAGSLLEVAEARLEGLTPNRPAPLHAELSYRSAADAEPMPVRLDGQFQVDPDTLEVALAETRVQTPDAEGTCNLQARPVADPPPAPAAAPEDVVPVAVLLSVDWQGDCLLDWVQIDDQRFEQVQVNVANHGGTSTATLHAPRFFGGAAQAEVALEANRSPLRWTVAPQLSGVDSAALLEWLNQNLTWAAPLAYGGTLTFEGNTTDAMIASMSGETRFDGGQGRIDISQIRTSLIKLASMFNEAERIRGWPEVWEYERFIGTWRIDDQHHRLDAALDNLNLEGAGDYLPATREVDMRFELTFTDNPELPVFDVDPLLYDLPIPVRCQGAIAEPECRVDPDAAQRIVAQALGSEDSELRQKLERKIDEDVPAEYRDAARSLLEALSGGSARNKEPHAQPREPTPGDR